MVYEFNLINEKSIPIFVNSVVNSKNILNICFDTGCGITTFYMDYNTIKMLYPDIQETNINASINDANGGMAQQPLYIIPDFILKDNNNSELHIINLYCCLSEASIPPIDVLLSGSAFYNTKLSISPRRNSNGAYRSLEIDTFNDSRDTLYMQRTVTKNCTHYICAFTESNAQVMPVDKN